MIKRFVFVKPFYNQNGDSIPAGTQVDIIDDKIFMSYETGGSQVAPSMYESLKKLLKTNIILNRRTVAQIICMKWLFLITKHK